MGGGAAAPNRRIPVPIRVRVTVAGSGDAFGSGRRLQTCVHVQPLGQEEAVLLDCGASALTSLKRFGLEPNDVTVVAVSHLHGDHFGGLPYPLLDGQFRHRDRPLRLIGPPGLQQRLAQAMEVLFPGSTTRRIRYHLDLPTLRANLQRLRCTRLLLTHPSPDLLAHRAELEPDLALAEDGTVVELD